MGLFGKVARGGAALAFGAGMGKLLSLVRNIIIARLLSPEDFGIAAIFILTLTFLQSVSEVAADKLLIQAKDGDDQQLQKSAHFFQIGRGLFGAAALFLLAGPVARLFGAPETEWAFRALAVVPLMRGFMHLDMRRVQRGLRYKPFIVVDLVSQAAAVVAAAPLAWWLGDYRAALWVLVVQSVVYCAATHALAERPYGAAFDAAAMKRLFVFGWPLMINGLLMFVVSQGDRLVIGAEASPYSLADLGVYAVAATLVMAPRQMLTRVATSLALPVLSKAQDDRSLFARRYRVCVEAATVVGAVVGVLMVVGGTELVVLLFGAKYAGVSIFIGWLAAKQTIRIIRTMPAIAGLAYADSAQLMLTTLARAITLVLLIAVAAAELSLAWIAAAGFAGELIALFAAVWLMARRHGLSPMATLGPTFIGCLTMGAAGAAVWAGALPGEGPASLVLGAAVSGLSGVALVGAFGSLRELAVKQVSRARKRRGTGVGRPIGVGAGPKDETA